MSKDYTEDSLVEQASEEILLGLKWTVKTAWHKESFATDDTPEAREKTLLGRLHKGEVILQRSLLTALKALNKGLPDVAYKHAMEQIISTPANKGLAAINKQKHELMTKGVPVSYQDDKGVLKKKRLKVFNFIKPEKNEFLAVRQFEIAGDSMASNVRTLSVL